MTDLVIEKVPLIRLTEDPDNARLHPERNMDAIKASLKAYGQVEPLVAQRSTGRVIGGNGRLRAMREMGWTEASVAWVDLDGARAKALGVALNRSSDMAEWDWAKLSETIEELSETDFDDIAGMTGFSDREIDALLQRPAETRGAGVGSEEIDLDRMDSSLENRCPRCGFRF